ncbi:ZIP Zinc transporter [Pelomyxa schiedti]|nr:ZIP Zinc transporter [Pelomyxa schiedti]
MPGFGEELHPTSADMILSSCDEPRADRYEVGGADPNVKCIWEHEEPTETTPMILDVIINQKELAETMAKRGGLLPAPTFFILLDIWIYACIATDTGDLQFHNFPLPFFLCLVGFTLVLILDQVASLLGGAHSHSHGHSHDHTHEEHEHLHDHHHDDHDHDHDHHDHDHDHHHDDENPDHHTNLEDIEVELDPEPACTHCCCTISKAQLRKLMIRITKAVAYTLSLSVHSFISGIALGLPTKASDVLVVLIAVLAHEWAETAGLSAVYQKMGFGKQARFFMIVAYSFVTPFGLFVGSMISASGESAQVEIIEGVLLAISAGTFLYGAAVELLPVSLLAKHNKLAKIVIFVTSFTLISSPSQQHHTNTIIPQPPTDSRPNCRIAMASTTSITTSTTPAGGGGGGASEIEYMRYRAKKVTGRTWVVVRST